MGDDKSKKAAAAVTMARQAPLVSGAGRLKLTSSTEQLCAVGLDCSTSMRGTKLDEAKDACITLASLLGAPENRDAFSLGVVTFSDDAQEHLAPKKASAITPADLSFQAGGNTNIAAALERAREVVVRTAQPPRWLRSVCVLLTDGQHNQAGDPLSAAGRLKAHADVIAIGFGDDADFNLLRRLASDPALAIRCPTGNDLRRFFALVGTSMSAAARSGQNATAVLLGGGVVKG